MAKRLKSRVWDTLKGGTVAGLMLYPAGKLVWAGDSMARNFIGPGLPQEARLPIVTLALGSLAAAIPNKWAGRAGEAIIAAGLVQFLQTAGNGGTGLPGTIDQAVNKVFQPVANLGMQGYTRKLAGSVARTMQGYIPDPRKKMDGYVKDPGQTRGAGAMASMGSLNMPLGGRRSKLRGYTTIRV